MAGFGLQPAGTSNAGYGTPNTAATLTGKLFQDPTTGKVHGGRYIDPAARDYRLNEDDRLAGMDNVQQMVHLAIHTRRASSAIANLGNRLHELEVITGNFEKLVLAILVEAIQPLIDGGIIAVLGFSTFRIGPDGNLLPGAAWGRFRYRDLTTGLERETGV